MWSMVSVAVSGQVELCRAQGRDFRWRRMLSVVSEVGYWPTASASCRYPCSHSYMGISIHSEIIWGPEGLGVRLRVAWQGQSLSRMTSPFLASSPSPQHHTYTYIATPQPNQNHHAAPLDCFGTLQHHAWGDGIRVACDRAVHARGTCVL